MSQRKAKEYRQAMEQYRGAVEDVDDLKRRIGAMEARHRREDQLEEIRRRQARREAEQWEKKRRKAWSKRGGSGQRNGGGSLPDGRSLS